MVVTAARVAAGGLPPTKGSAGLGGDASQAWAAEEGAGCEPRARQLRQEAGGGRVGSQPACFPLALGKRSELFFSSWTQRLSTGSRESVSRNSLPT